MNESGYASGPLAINRIADRLEAELRRLGAWSDTPLPPEKMQFTRAFGGDTMAFEQWIQFVLVPRLREIGATGGSMPPSSQLRAYAVREFDGREDEMAALIDLLGAVDDLCPPPRARHAPVERPPVAAVALVLTGTLIWAGVSLWAAGEIAHRIAAEQPARVLAYSHYMGDSAGVWRGLTIEAWGWESGGSLRAYEASVALPARPRDGAPPPAAFSIDIDFDASPPAVSLPSGEKLPLSPVVITNWAYGETPPPGVASADPVPLALWELLDGLKTGTTAKAVESTLSKIGQLIGDSSVLPSVKRYPASVGTGLFVGVFSAIFVPPMLVWMVWRYRKNRAERRG